MNIMVVDDEKEIRDGLSFMINNLRMEYGVAVVVGLAGDGREALEVIMGREVHVVITDIRMPKMDGLQLIEELRARYTTIQAIVLSGHEDFSKVQQALRLNAVDYLLKPIKEDELKSSLARAYRQHKQQLQRAVFSSWEAFIEGEEPLRLIIAVSVVPDHEGGQSEGLLHRVAAGTIAEFNHGVCSLQYEMPKQDVHKSALLGFSASQESELLALLERFVDKLTARMQEGRDVRLGIGVSNMFNKDAAQATAYSVQACTALLRRMFEGPGVYRLEAGSAPMVKVLIEPVLGALDVADISGLADSVKQEVDRLMQSRNVQTVQRGVEFILLSIVKRLHERGQSQQDVNSRHISELLTKLLWSPDEQTYQSVLLDGIGQLLIRLAPTDLGSQTLQRAKAYIRSHYDRQLTLAEVSKAVYVSPNYLSYLFREEEDTTFLEFLTGLRMQEAKALLLQPGIKIYEVAEKVGYGNWKHFSRVFKEATSYSPADYRKRAIPALDSDIE